MNIDERIKMVFNLYKSPRTNFFSRDAFRLLKSIDLLDKFKHFYKYSKKLQFEFTSNKNVKMFGHFDKSSIPKESLEISLNDRTSFGRTYNNGYRITSDVFGGFSEFRDSYSNVTLLNRGRHISAASSIFEPLSAKKNKFVQKNKEKYNFKPLLAKNLYRKLNKSFDFSERLCSSNSYKNSSKRRNRASSLDTNKKIKIKDIEAHRKAITHDEVKDKSVEIHKNKNRRDNHLSGIFSILNCEKLLEEDRDIEERFKKKSRMRHTTF